MSAIERVRTALAMRDADYGTLPSSEDVASLLRQHDLLQGFVDFVNLWCRRDNVTDAERVSVIKHHPMATSRHAVIATSKCGEK